MSEQKFITSIIKPKAPKGEGWKFIQPFDSHGYDGAAYQHLKTGLCVISCVEVAEEKLGPEFHVSVSKMGQRCSSEEAAWVVEQFDMLGADEDNHVPFGKVRNFWKPVAEKLHGYVCPCENDEQAIKEDKGDYVWREDKS
jgi:hypothetical protein